MPADKALVMAKLTELTAGKSITKNYKEQVVNAIFEAIENDEAIEGYLNDRMPFIVAASTEGDRRASQASKAKTPEPTTDLPEPAPTAPRTETEKLMEMVRSLTETVTTMQQQKQVETLSQRWDKDERLKDVPEYFRKLAMPKDETSYDAAVEALTKEWQPIAQQHQNAGFNVGTPGGGLKNPGKVTEASKEQLDAVMSNLPI